MLIRLKNFCLDILFPLHCLSCGLEGSFLCASCTTTLPSVPPACIGCGMLTPSDNSHSPGHTCLRCKKKTFISAFFSPLAYQHPLVRDLIHTFKYRRIRGLSPVFADTITSYLQYYRISLPEHSVIMPIPLHPRKQRLRGFNQAGLLAEDLCLSLLRPLETNNLIRIVSRPPQAKMDAKHRRMNTENMFALLKPQDVRGKHIILIDDVKTTGTTLEQAAIVLKKAGAKRIWAITVAH